MRRCVIVAIVAIVVIAPALIAFSAPAAASSNPTARLRVEAQRGHSQCPVAGLDDRSVLLDDAAQWRAVVATTEAQALGREVHWGRERVLVHALAQQPTLGVRVSAVGVTWAGPLRSPRLDMRITRPGPNDMAATALSRPCVFVAMTRGAWRELRVTGGGAPKPVIVRVGLLPKEAAAGPPRMRFDGVELVKPAAPAASR